MSTPTPNKRSARELRKAFLDYFEGKGHAAVASSGVVPRGDATLLFTNAGMVQFKDVFTGKEKRPYSRATTAQKCIRMSGKHNDLENVGRTARHHTFFEMLGNFSFGDYFKRDAIAYAWELLTEVLGVPRERLVITVFGGEDGLPADDEARALWREVTGFGDDRIFGLGKADNFWSMGDTGPCGPCTEIHYAMGDMDPDPKTFGQEPRADGTGWVEIWNLVFMQFDRSADGVLTPLPAQSVDTGMGLERLTAVLQGVTSNYDTDLFQPLIQLGARLSGHAYQRSNSETDVALRVLADHARLAAMCLSEGVTPGPNGRNSALRQVVRRAIFHGMKKLGLNEPFFDALCLEVVEQFGDVYPLLVEKREFIAKQARQEELAFRETIQGGLALLAEFRDYQLDDGKKVMPGAVAFDLYATHGFPLDLTRVIGEEQGFVVDAAGFDAAREKHAQVSRGRKTVGHGVDELYKQARARLEAPVAFVGYDGESCASKVALLLAHGELRSALAVGEEAEVVTLETPFYGESGGQVGDAGVLRTARGALFRVRDTQRPVDGLVVHVGSLDEGSLEVGEAVTLEVDHATRSATRRNHSATHLLHWALRKVLGAATEQRGSKVGPTGLRFDYSTDRTLSADELAQLEDLVNAEVLANLPVRTEVTSQDGARAAGAMMIFEENYGDVVRMLRIGSESIELCGGTHVGRTGDIGLFKITSDEPLGRGIRRVSAVTGGGALAHLRELEGKLKQAAALLKSVPAEVPARVGKVLDEQRELQRTIQELKRKALEGGGGPQVDVREVLGAKLGAVVLETAEPKEMLPIAEKLRDKHGLAAVFAVGVAADGALKFTALATKADSAWASAGKLVGAVSGALGGRGGGRPDMAQGGVPAGKSADDAVAAFWVAAAALSR